MNDNESSMKVADDQDKEPNWGLWVIGSIICVALMFGLLAYLQHIYVSRIFAEQLESDPSALGISGDFFGFSNAVFSALAFALIIVTLWMQKYELSQQREELRDTRGVMKGQQAEFAQQNKSLTRQTFERTFFSMLSMHTEIVQGMAVRGGQEPGGRPAFMNFTHKLHQMMHQHQKDRSSVQSYEAWYCGSEAEIGHYFRTLYNMMRFIDERGAEDKKMYARLVRAQLSTAL